MNCPVKHFNNTLVFWIIRSSKNILNKSFSMQNWDIKIIFDSCSILNLQGCKNIIGYYTFLECTQYIFVDLSFNGTINPFLVKWSTIKIFWTQLILHVYITTLYLLDIYFRLEAINMLNNCIVSWLWGPYFTILKLKVKVSNIVKHIIPSVFCLQHFFIYWIYFQMRTKI